MAKPKTRRKRPAKHPIQVEEQGPHTVAKAMVDLVTDEKSQNSARHVEWALAVTLRVGIDPSTHTASLECDYSASYCNQVPEDIAMFARDIGEAIIATIKQKLMKSQMGLGQVTFTDFNAPKADGN